MKGITMTATPNHKSVVQDWVSTLPFMQQSVLLTAVRGPDGLPKYHPVKYVLRWYRRCILLSSFKGQVLYNPWVSDGRSFLGASIETPQLGLPWMPAMDDRITDYIRSLDEVPHHFQLHLLHAVEIVGYHHPDGVIADWWNEVYTRLVADMHLFPESMDQLDARLSDDRDRWLARGDVATND